MIITFSDGNFRFGVAVAGCSPSRSSGASSSSASACFALAAAMKCPGSLVLGGSASSVAPGKRRRCATSRPPSGKVGRYG